MVAILIQNVSGTPMTTIPTTDTSFYTNNVQSNEYQNVRVSTALEINTTGTSKTANVAIKLKINGTTLRTLNFQTDPVARTTNQQLEWVGDLSQGGVLAVTASTAVADAATTITAKNIYVSSVE